MCRVDVVRVNKGIQRDEAMYLLQQDVLACCVFLI